MVCHSLDYWRVVKSNETDFLVYVIIPLLIDQNFSAYQRARHMINHDEKNILKKEFIYICVCVCMYKTESLCYIAVINITL